jgi:hypothetical protein
MGFFADVPRPPPVSDLRPFAFRRPEWTGPPENVLPGVLGAPLVLVNTGAVAIAVTGLAAWPAGALITVALRRRALAGDEELDPFAWHHPVHAGSSLRFGVGFPDGRKAVVGAWPLPGPEQPPEQPVLMPRGGGGGGLAWEQELWLWPLPPPGPVELVCSWPDQGIEEARATIDGAELGALAERAIELWPDERPLPGPGDEW